MPSLLDRAEGTCVWECGRRQQQARWSWEGSREGTGAGGAAGGRVSWQVQARTWIIIQGQQGQQGQHASHKLWQSGPCLQERRSARVWSCSSLIFSSASSTMGPHLRSGSGCRRVVAGGQVGGTGRGSARRCARCRQIANGTCLPGGGNTGGAAEPQSTASSLLVEVEGVALVGGWSITVRVPAVDQELPLQLLFAFVFSYRCFSACSRGCTSTFLSLSHPLLQQQKRGL